MEFKQNFEVFRQDILSIYSYDNKFDKFIHAAKAFGDFIEKYLEILNGNFIY